jgi:RNA polymerase sigma-70 factor (ECF subfamily)
MEPIDVAEAWQGVGERLRAYVSRRIDAADADDVVQSVMLKLLEHRDRIGAGSVRAWLFTVARNAIAEHYRQKRPSVDVQDFVDDLPAHPTDPVKSTLDALSVCLEPMLRALAPADADVLRKVDLEGRSQTALATALGLPLSTVKSRVQRARTRLRAAFDACCAIERARDGSPISFERGAACAPPPCGNCHE